MQVLARYPLLNLVCGWPLKLNEVDKGNEYQNQSTRYNIVPGVDVGGPLKMLKWS